MTAAPPLRPRLAKAAKGALGIALFLAAWQASVPLIGLESYFYPAPADVWVAFLDLIRKGMLPIHAIDSLGRYASGVMLGAVAGVILGERLPQFGNVERRFHGLGLYRFR